MKNVLLIASLLLSTGCRAYQKAQIITTDSQGGMANIKTKYYPKTNTMKRESVSVATVWFYYGTFSYISPYIPIIPVKQKPSRVRRRK
jgi:hypothetical protein